jgi:hypothetical protein
MIWWQCLGIAWFILGLAIIAAIELAARSSDSEGPLSSGKPAASIVYCAVLIIGAPLVALFGLGICAQVLWQGRIPITNRVWWPARAVEFADRETALCDMIDIRQRRDPRLRREQRPSNWPMSELWRTTEATILDTVEQYRWLRDGGLVEKVALETLEVNQNGSVDFSVKPNATLHSYIARWLSTVDPDYLRLGGNVLRKVILFAEKWSRAEISRVKSDRPFPPADWLLARVGVREIESGEDLPFKGEGIVSITFDGQVERPGRTIPSYEWKRIKSRMLSTDELWTFSSPAEYWQNRAGRMGIALIRNGHPIGHVITLKN